jgi:hypothetical protein
VSVEVTSRRQPAEAVFADCMTCGKKIAAGGDVRRRARKHAADHGHKVFVTVEHTLIYEPVNARSV